MAPVHGDLDGIAGQQRAVAVGAAGPVQHSAAGKMAAAADQRQARRDLALVVLPIDDRLIGPHDPLAIGGVQVDRRAAERSAPLDHGAIEMRVRDRDRIDAALRLDRTQRRLVDQAHAVPQHVAADAFHQQAALADRERRLDADAGEVLVLLAQHHAMALLQIAKRGPALALPGNILALVGADRADPRRLIGLGELHAAGDADRMHGITKSPCPPADPIHLAVAIPGVARSSGASNHRPPVDVAGQDCARLEPMIAACAAEGCPPSSFNPLPGHRRLARGQVMWIGIRSCGALPCSARSLGAGDVPAVAVLSSINTRSCASAL